MLFVNADFYVATDKIILTISFVATFTVYRFPFYGLTGREILRKLLVFCLLIDSIPIFIVFQFYSFTGGGNKISVPVNGIVCGGKLGYIFTNQFFGKMNGIVFLIN